MADFGTIPYGVDDLRLAPITGSSNTVGTKVDLVGVRGLSFNTASDANRLEGDNKVIAVARSAKTLSGTIDWGQIIPEALAVSNGGSVVTTGTTPAQVKTLSEDDSIASRYYQIEMTAPSQDAGGSQYYCLLPKETTTSGLDEAHTVNDWATPTISFEGVSIAGILVTRKFYETAVALT
jgi:hypothetical protein